MEEGICGIYCIENTINGKKYIGQSRDIATRYRNHFTGMKNGWESSILLQRAWDKYGKENFCFKIIELCEIFLLNDKEIYWIKNTRSHYSEHGYNISWGGDSPMQGRNHSSETKLKISINRTGKGMPAWNKGTRLNPETIKKFNKAMEGRREKIRQGISNKYSKESICFVGITIDKKCVTNPFRARITVEGEIIELGHYSSEIDAAEAYNNAALLYYGEDAKLNDLCKNTEDYYHYPKRDADLNQGKKLRKNTSSKYVGISWKNKYNKWQASISKDKKRYYKYANTEIEAAKLYNQMAIELYGDKAKLNVI